MTFSVVKKTQYWAGLDDAFTFKSLGGFTLKALDGLKHIQDVVTLDALKGLRNKKVLEVGGGVSRVLPALNASNERWNLDEFKGVGNGVTDAAQFPGVKLVQRNLGEFAEELPNSYFDAIFSISVIEHIQQAALRNFWKDQARILKKGGRAFHTIDLYLGAAGDDNTERRVDSYLDYPIAAGFKFVDTPDLVRPLVFHPAMASNSDWGMWRWNKVSPTLMETRKDHQSVTLWVVMEKA